MSDRSVEPGIRIDFLGVHWRGAGREGGAVRLRRKGRWGAWQPLHAGELHPPGRMASELMAAHGASAYKVRAPAGARDVRVVAINTSEGSRRPVRAAQADGPTGSGLGWSRWCYVSRAGWGADESLRFDGTGAEVWPPQYFPVQRLTLHHTATETGGAGGSDPAAIVRAIYRYHAVDLGFGDVGYQLLIDERGCVYEGRYSGPDPIPVYGGLPQPWSPPAAVNAGHVTGFNAGNIGVALIGNFEQADPSRPALRSLKLTLAALAAASQLDPLGHGTYVNPLTGATKESEVISGHRDWLATECPGERLYARLPALREAVAGLAGRRAIRAPWPPRSN